MSNQSASLMDLLGVEVSKKKAARPQKARKAGKSTKDEGEEKQKRVKASFTPHQEFPGKGVLTFDDRRKTIDEYVESFMNVWTDMRGNKNVKWIDVMAEYFNDLYGSNPERVAMDRHAPALEAEFNRYKDITETKVVLNQPISMHELFIYLFHNQTVGVELYSRGDQHIQVVDVLNAKLSIGFWTEIRLNVQCIRMGEHTVETYTDTMKITPDAGEKEIRHWGVHPLTQELKDRMLARGKIFHHACVTGASHMMYTGNGIIKRWMGVQYVPSTGRVMVDIRGLDKLAPNFSYIPFSGYADRETALPTQLHETEDTLLRYPAYAPAFSFSSRAWVNIFVEQLVPIEFDDTVFRKLVYDETTKGVLLTLIGNRKGKKQDLIDGKGSGLIVLMEGPPGVGKTLTAETVAETMHKPLYSVTAGELGVTPDELESNLQRVLNTARDWSAVLLIDEADIFLEKRDTSDVFRNAMVSTFLRLLEYYSGVLFLTTNRVSQMDPALFSRISLTLSYKEHQEADRFAVLKTLLTLYPDHTLTEDDLKEIASKYRYNGRRFKSMFAMADTLASAEGKTLDINSFNRIISINAAADNLNTANAN